MKVLVACEESQAVCKEFRKLGHEAYSCDIQECSGGHPEWHIKGDAIQVINREKWDMIIAFPPCTDLSAAGAPSWKQKQEDGRQQAAIDFVYAIRDADCEFIAIENPTGKLNTSWRKPDQIIQPWQFGHEAQKTTCLWLKNLPNLKHTKVVDKGEFTTFKSGKRHPKWYADALKLSKHERMKARSKTFQGIADAMAEQWGDLQ